MNPPPASWPRKVAGTLRVPSPAFAKGLTLEDRRRHAERACYNQLGLNLGRKLRKTVITR